MLWLIHAEPTPDPLKSVASQTGADVQKPAPLAIVALDLCCIYTHEQPFQFEEWVVMNIIRHPINGRPELHLNDSNAQVLFLGNSL